jgi:lipocalin
MKQNYQLTFFLSLVVFVNASNTNNCSKIQLQTNPPINLTEYIKHTWYIQQQQITGYQPSNSLYCVTATYNIDNYSHVPFFNGKVLSVYNYANYKKINGNSMTGTNPLCARLINSSEPEKLYVSPCFLPNLFSGPYWIIAAGPKPHNYTWSIIGGGQPTLPKKNNTCGYKLDGFKNSGLWIFSRNQIMPNSTIISIKEYLDSQGIFTGNLIPVPQEGCKYKNAFIK